MSTAAREAEAVIRDQLRRLIALASGRLPQGYAVPPVVNALTAQELRDAVDDYSLMIQRW